ncbi:MAG: flavin reductase family protein [Gammaproteobacteria bacterium]|nr:flavin reductase family protein [Gammaproteobacteria bacterium]MCP5199962.1 flavin reductase family protein [Gammaproteobacteria bacterium]
MDESAKKTTLRMIPYGLYILTGANEAGEVAAATINWVTQSSFKPPQLAIGVKADSGAHDIIKASGHFALNVLGKDQQGLAFAFFKPAERDGHTVNGEPFEFRTTGSPVLEAAIAYLECKLVHTYEGGDHSVFVGEVVDAGVQRSPEGRPDLATLTLEDLGEKVFYGG